MVVKTLTIKKTVYDELVKIKKDNESFSDLFERLAKKEKPDLLKYAGILTEKEAEIMKKEINKHRKDVDKSAKKRGTYLQSLWSK